MVNNVEQLKSISKLIRKDIISMLTESASGHPGGSLSAADIVTTLFFKEMNIDPSNPKNPDRDRFVLSKGHAAPVLYSALARKGFLPVEELNTLRKFANLKDTLQKLVDFLVENYFVTQINLIECLNIAVCIIRLS